MSLSKELAYFVKNVKLSDFPDRAIEIARNAIRDCISVAIKACDSECGKIIMDYAGEFNREPLCSVFGTGFKTTPDMAAVVNGTLSHALDFDDVNNTMQGHPSVALVPAVFAIGEYVHASGADVLLAYLTGFEVQCRIGRIARPSHYATGYHATATMGTFGATAACAKLLNLDEDQIMTAIGIASSMATGMRDNFGTMTKPLHAGLAAEHGITASLLARKGFTSNKEMLFTDKCFNKILNIRQEIPASDVFTIDKNKTEIMSDGIWIKLYPSCACTHLALDGLFGILKRNNITYEKIKRIFVTVNPWAMDTLIHNRPTIGLEAKFSMQYCLAVAAIDGKVTLDSFEDSRVQKPDVQELLRRVEVTQDESYGRIYMNCTVGVETVDGFSESVYVKYPMGCHENPSPEDDLKEKFRSCLKGCTVENNVDKILDLFDSFTEVEDISNLVKLITV